MRIAVLALQGAFIEHERMLQQLGAECFEVRQLSDWNQPKDGLVIPGGESTTMLKLLHDLELLQPIREAIAGGLPVFGTCAGLILLAKEVEGEEFPRLSTMDIRARRNAYGRQLGSFHTSLDMAEVGTGLPATFIRAPYIERRARPGLRRWPYRGGKTGQPARHGFPSRTGQRFAHTQILPLDDRRIGFSALSGKCKQNLLVFPMRPSIAADRLDGLTHCQPGCQAIFYCSFASTKKVLVYSLSCTSLFSARQLYLHVKACTLTS